MSLKHNIVRQFQHPSGLPGAVAGHIMARRTSNRLRNTGTIGLMDLRPAMHVLEVGCGPGLALEGCSGIVTAGRIVGLDHSAVMIAQARARLAKAGLADRVDLVLGGIERLETWNGAFDRIFSLNVIQFLHDKAEYFTLVYRALSPGGECFTTYQPRLEEDAAAAFERQAAAIREAMRGSGFEAIETLPVSADGTEAHCITGRRGAA